MKTAPIIIAHRGASGSRPENTLAAFEYALEIGVDRIELDLRQTIDGVVVAIHDKTIMRTTNGWGSVRKMSFNKLRRYSAGSWFHHSYSSEKIPSFQEILELVNGRATLLLEIKEGSPYHHGIEKNITELVNQNKANEWCIVQSFNDKVLQNFRSLENFNTDMQKLLTTFIPVAPFYGGSRFSYKRIKRYDFAEEINVNYKYVTPRVVRKLHQMNKKINIWTVNDAEDLKRFVDMGVDGIITDYPERLQNVIE